jgi:hypothetical protein
LPGRLAGAGADGGLDGTVELAGLNSSSKISLTGFVGVLLGASSHTSVGCFAMITERFLCGH